jgi:hypothetical protein
MTCTDYAVNTRFLLSIDDPLFTPDIAPAFKSPQGVEDLPSRALGFLSYGLSRRETAPIIVGGKATQSHIDRLSVDIDRLVVQDGIIHPGVSEGALIFDL